MSLSLEARAAAAAAWLQAAEFAQVMANTTELRARGLISDDERRFGAMLARSLRGLAVHYRAEADRLGPLDPDRTPPDGTTAERAAALFPKRRTK